MERDKSIYVIVFIVTVLMAVYFILGHFRMMDDGFQYEGFTESAARGDIDFKSFYGFQGLSFFAIPIFLLTHSHNSIIFTSIIFVLLSISIIYICARDLYQSERAGIYGIILFLLMPYSYTTLMRGFQEAALTFFIILIILGSLNKKSWTPLSWAVGGIVKPFALVLLPLFAKGFLSNNSGKTWSQKILWIFTALLFGVVYLGTSYYQTGHLINNAAINSYQGNFNTGSPPPLTESFTIGIKGYLRVGANLFLSFRKIIISPLVIILGAISLLFGKNLKLKKEMILAIVFNFILVGSLTFSFSKYLIPAVIIFALLAIPLIENRKWLMWLVFADSITVFIPIWKFFGNNFWSNLHVYLLPFWLAIALFVFYEYIFRKYYFNTNS